MPGWDCHGLPIENKVLKQLGVSSLPILYKLLTNFLLQVEINQLTPSQIRDEAEKLARKEVASQMEQFQALGIMADWSPETTYRTLGERHVMYSRVVH